MITWGLASGAFALIGGPTSFLVLRFLLGAAEAGFFPGVILYLTYWYPAVYRAKIVGIFMVAIPVAGMIGSPISGAVLGMDGILGLGRLAVDLHPGSDPRDPAWHLRVHRSDRPATPRRVVAARPTGVADRPAGDRANFAPLKCGTSRSGK